MTRLRALIVGAAAATAFLIPGCFDWEDPCDVTAAAEGLVDPCDV
jgi:hypothetical protein